MVGTAGATVSAAAVGTQQAVLTTAGHGGRGVARNGREHRRRESPRRLRQRRLRRAVVPTAPTRGAV